MSRLLKIALVWLLAMAIPLQAAAAASMVVCAPSHHGAAAEGHDHATHGHAAPSHLQAHDEAAPADGGPDPLAASTCSLCAACCTATALPSDVLSFDPPRIAHAPIAAQSAPMVVFLTGGLERPPRFPLA